MIATEHRPELQQHFACANRPNVGQLERIASSALGIALLAVAPWRRGTTGLVSALAGGALVYRGWTGNCPVYRALGKSTNEPSAVSDPGVAAQQGVRFEHEIVVRQPALIVYDFWRELRNLPQIIDHLESVIEDGDRSLWSARGPLGQLFQWQAEIIQDDPGRILAWQSVSNSDLSTAGSLRLEPLPLQQGTAVRLNLKYDPPGGQAGDAVARWLGTDVEQELRNALERMKLLLETSERATTVD
jgi:uncharacterized membrane protein